VDKERSSALTRLIVDEASGFADVTEEDGVAPHFSLTVAITFGLQVGIALAERNPAAAHAILEDFERRQLADGGSNDEPNRFVGELGRLVAPSARLN
jgi:hypothetical protein